MNAPPTRSQLLTELVRERIEPLQAKALLNVASAKATLAQLRACDPADVSADPRVWQVTIGDLPESLASPLASEPTRAERAVHAVMVLHALHLQAGSEPVHRRQARLGTAIGQLARERGGDGSLSPGILQRFHQLVLTSDASMRLHHLRGLIVMMRTASRTIALDYGLLAADLDRLANPHTDPSSVLTRWGRDLHRKPKTDQETAS